MLKKLGYISDFLDIDDAFNVEVMLDEENFDLRKSNEYLLLSDANKFDVLKKIEKYSSIYKLLAGKSKSINKEIEREAEGLKDGFYVFGAHKVGAAFVKQCVVAGVKVLGFFDNDSTKHGTKLNGLEIYPPTLQNLTKKSIVVASGRYTNEIFTQLATCNCSIYNLHQAQYIFQLPHQAEKNFRDYHSDLHGNKNRFVSAFLQLDDEKSRVVFDGLLRLRLDLSVLHTDQFKSRFSNEYADRDFINANDFYSYVDVGAYDGDTLDRLEAIIGNVGAAYLFEPEIDPYIRAIEKYSTRDNIFLFNFGLSSKLQKFSYHGEYSHDIFDLKKSTSKTSAVQVIELDSIGFIEPTFIKIDVEGAELLALQGAKQKIITHSPKLAVCCYHRANDYWEIINFMKNTNPTYKVGMRHYSDILDDTSLYFYQG